MRRLAVLVSAGWLALAALTAFASPASDAASKKRELDALKSQLQSLQREYRETTQARGSVASELARVERAVSDSARELREISARQALGKQRLRELEANAAAMQTRVDARQKQLAESLRASHARDADSALKLLLAGDDPNQSARDLRALARVSEARASQIAELRENQAELARLRNAVVAEDRTLASLSDAERVQQQKLEADRVQRATTLTRLSKEIDSQRRAIATLQSDQKALTKLVERLNRLVAQRAREAAAREAAARKKQAAQEAKARAAQARAAAAGKPALPGKPTPAEPAAKPARPVAVTTRTPEAGQPTGRFAKLKGALRLPVAGELLNRYGTPRDGGMNWKGLFIRAKRGSPVKAVAAGQVVFAEWMRGFGNLIVVDHGDGYMSLYSNNESLYKRVGDRVSSGDALAAVGNSGGAPDTGLYFELRHQSRTLNPMTWVK